MAVEPRQRRQAAGVSRNRLSAGGGAAVAANEVGLTGTRADVGLGLHDVLSSGKSSGFVLSAAGLSGAFIGVVSADAGRFTTTTRISTGGRQQATARDTRRRHR